MTLGEFIYELMEIKERHGGAVPVQTLGEADSYHEKVDEVFYREEGTVVISHRRFENKNNENEVEI